MITCIYILTISLYTTNKDDYTCGSHGIKTWSLCFPALGPRAIGYKLRLVRIGTIRSIGIRHCPRRAQ